MKGIADVARLAGVSKSTASRALTGTGYVSDETRLRVATAARSVGYVPSASAVSLASGRTSTVGVIMPGVTGWFFAEVLEGIQESLLEAGLDLALYDARVGTRGRDRIFDDFLARQRFDGLIAVGIDPEDRELERIYALNRPVVSIASGGFPDDIAIDDVDVARRATEHLIGLGHHHILFLGGGDGGRWSHVERHRFEGYQATMDAAGARAEHAQCGESLPAGYAAAADLLSDLRTRPTGIVAVSDEVAIGAIIAARRLGIGVPHDLSVIGVDDHEYAEMFSLTTLAQDPRAQGALAVEVLLERLADPDAPVPVVAPQARLIVRNSTAAPAG
ncbi:LacI family DNA-binding transcriptional regulator [Microbacterium sp. ASV49]|uniref:LacI family DNA-binding transcriptional regulator n=1 Tax=Microbacterium candidum TaxID=3041922 RepID=A0ABT7N3S3_9MICO|nr:LacI family DNA-binding transcriptional regulator [Microbacterium sp. ASV49]MDL9981354.1 LacI family DNA-binding transcriptional regulator [Microbacterium sp. ASV49]